MSKTFFFTYSSQIVYMIEHKSLCLLTICPLCARHIGQQYKSSTSVCFGSPLQSALDLHFSLLWISTSVCSGSQPLYVLDLHFSLLWISTSVCSGSPLHSILDLNPGMSRISTSACPGSPLQPVVDPNFSLFWIPTPDYKHIDTLYILPGMLAKKEKNNHHQQQPKPSTQPLCRKYARLDKTDEGTKNKSKNKQKQTNKNKQTKKDSSSWKISFMV